MFKIETIAKNFKIFWSLKYARAYMRIGRCAPALTKLIHATRPTGWLSGVDLSRPECLLKIKLKRM